MRRSARQVARYVALDALALRDRMDPRARQDCTGPHVHLLYLHTVPPHELDGLRNLLSSVSRDHRLVSYSEAVEQVLSGPSESLVALSFDDGFASNMLAAGVVEEFDTSACFFVPTGFVGCTDVAAARAYFGTSAGVDEPALTWADLEELLGRGHEIGNHTVSHRVLSRLSPHEAQAEIDVAGEVLASRLGQGHHFAWPLGRFEHFTGPGARAVFDSGHLSCASAERGAHAGPPDSPAPCLRRDHVMTSWPLRHSLHFVQDAYRRPTDGAWPDAWQL